MLVLKRQVGETIVIDNNIRITVVAVHGKLVRLGITAPASVTVRRQELLAEIALGGDTTANQNVASSS